MRSRSLTIEPVPCPPWLAAGIAKKKISPVEVLEAVLDRIERLRPLNAYVTLDAGGARKAARAAERAVMKKGARLGPLHGVPFSVKDLVVTKGVRTTFGTPFYKDNVPDEDAPMVDSLKRAGAVIMAGTRNPGAFRRLGLQTAPDFDAAWKIARRYVGDHPTTVVAPTFWTRPRIKFSVKA